MSSTTELRSELRLRTRTTLDHLETKDLCNQSSIGLQRICDRCTNPADLALVLKEVLAGLACAGAQARRVRYKYATASELAVCFAILHSLVADVLAVYTELPQQPLCRGLQTGLGQQYLHLPNMH